MHLVAVAALGAVLVGAPRAAAQECATLTAAFAEAEAAAALCDVETFAAANASLTTVAAACAGAAPCPSMGCVLAVGSAVDAVTACSSELDAAALGGFLFDLAECQGCPSPAAFSASLASLPTTCGTVLGGSTDCSTCQATVDALFPDLGTCSALLLDPDTAAAVTAAVGVCTPGVAPVAATCDMTQVAAPFASTCFELDPVAGDYLPCGPSGCSNTTAQGCTFACAGSLSLASPFVAGCAARLSATELGLVSSAGTVCATGFPGCDMTTYASTIASLLGIDQGGATDTEDGCWCALSTSDFVPQSTCSDTCQALLPAALAGFEACQDVLEGEVVAAVLGSNAMCNQGCELQTLFNLAAELEDDGACSSANLAERSCTTCRPVVESMLEQGVLNCNSFFTEVLQEDDLVFSAAALNGICPSCADQAAYAVEIMDHACVNAQDDVCLDICFLRVSEVGAILQGECSSDTAAGATILGSNFAANLALCEATFGASDGTCEDVNAGIAPTPEPFCLDTSLAAAQAAVSGSVPTNCGYSLEDDPITAAAVCPGMPCVLSIALALGDVTACSDSADLNADALAYYGVAAATCGGCPTADLFVVQGACAATLASGTCDAGCSAAMSAAYPDILRDSCAPLLADVGGADGIAGLAALCGIESAEPSEAACDMTALAPAAADTCVSLVGENEYQFCDAEGCSATTAPTCTLTCASVAAPIPSTMPAACFLEGRLSETEVDLFSLLGLQCRGCDIAALTVAANMTANECGDFSSACTTSECSCPSSECESAYQTFKSFEVPCSDAVTGVQDLHALQGLGAFCDDGDVASDTSICDMTIYGSMLADMGGLGADPNKACLCDTPVGPIAIPECDADCAARATSVNRLIPGCQAETDGLAGLIIAGSNLICQPCALEISGLVNKMDTFCAVADEDSCLDSCRSVLDDMETALADCAGDASLALVAASDYETYVALCDAVEAGPNYGTGSGAGTAVQSVWVAVAAAVAAVVAMVV